MQRGILAPVSVFHAEKINPPKGSINGTNLQNEEILEGKVHNPLVPFANN
jgi:hypothetical protein